MQDEKKPSGGEGEKSAQEQPGLSELESIKSKVSEYENDVKRIQAEFENYKKRTDKEKSEWLLRGRLEGIREFLVLADEFDEAAKIAKNSSHEQLSKGITLLHSKLHSILKSGKVEEIGCGGFADPSLHDVLLQQEGGEEGKISAVIRKGYKCGAHILRHAQVAVYSGQKTNEKNEGSPKEKAEKNDEAPNENAEEKETGKQSDSSS